MSDEEVECPCCRLTYPAKKPEVFRPRTVPLDPRTGICWDCMNHQGDAESVRKARGRHHGQMLRREYQTARRELAAARQELLDRPVRIEIRVENLDKQIVAAALAQVDDAYQTRDVAMGALSDLRLRHRKNPTDRSRCVCGKPFAKCEEGQIADGWDGIEWWERDQAEKAWLGEFSRLHPQHPAREDRKWFEQGRSEAR